MFQLCSLLFFPNKGLHDDVLVLNEVVVYAMRNNKGLFLFKLVFKKAFDYVSWDYLLYILKRMTFDNKGLKWMHVCVLLLSQF